jgi:hypothetical protein
MHNKNIYSEKWKNSSCAATIQCAREHFSYYEAAYPRSLEGTLLVKEPPVPSTEKVARHESVCTILEKRKFLVLFGIRTPDHPACS